MRILLVEDERELAAATYQLLRAHDYEVDIASTGALAIDQASVALYDCILLDINLPDFSGFEVCRRLREVAITSSIIMLTSRDDQQDVVTGLKAGADDYITKPFSSDILFARIESAARRTGSYSIDQRLTLLDLVVDPQTRRCWRNDNEIDLSKREFELLHYLMVNQKQAVPRDKILNHVWGEYNDHTDNIIDVYVGYLRKKIDTPFDPPLIQTLRGYGYALRPPEENQRGKA